MTEMKLYYHQDATRCMVFIGHAERHEAFIMNILCKKQHLFLLFDRQIAMHLRDAENITFEWALFGENGKVIMKCEPVGKCLFSEIRRVFLSLSGCIMPKELSRRCRDRGGTLESLDLEN